MQATTYDLDVMVETTSKDLAILLYIEVMI